MFYNDNNAIYRARIVYERSGYLVEYHLSCHLRWQRSSCNIPFLLPEVHLADDLHRTGATGFIGGEALHHVYNVAGVRPKIAALVRNSEKASRVTKAFPEVRTVLGDLDAVDIIEEESRKADVVFRMCIQHCSLSVP